MPNNARQPRTPWPTSSLQDRAKIANLFHGCTHTSVLLIVETNSGTRYSFTIRPDHARTVMIGSESYPARNAWARREGKNLPDVTQVAFEEGIGSFHFLNDDNQCVFRPTGTVNRIISLVDV